MNKKNVSIVMIVVSVSLLFLSSCQTVKKTIAPDGFAAYTGTTEPFRAVSPDGVMFSVRSTKNEPYAALDFWKVALKKHLLDSGYYFIKEADIKSGTETGYMLEVSAPVDNQSYIYATAIFVQKDKIIIAESAGTVLSFESKRKAVMDAIRNLRIEE